MSCWGLIAQKTCLMSDGRSIDLYLLSLSPQIQCGLRPRHAPLPCWDSINSTTPTVRLPNQHCSVVDRLCTPEACIQSTVYLSLLGSGAGAEGMYPPLLLLLHWWLGPVSEEQMNKYCVTESCLFNTNDIIGFANCYASRKAITGASLLDCCTYKGSAVKRKHSGRLS